MAAAPSVTPPPDSAVTSKSNPAMVALVVFLFFAWGFVTNLNDPLIAKFKGLFSLNYAEAMLTQFAFFLGYLIFSIPAGILLSRAGYVRTIVAGLVIMAVGYLLFAPAAMAGLYWGFLLALFVTAAGITILQVAANPYIAVLGPQRTSSARLTLAQAFNSLATTIGPFVGALYLLRGGVAAPQAATQAALQAARVAEAKDLLGLFLGIAAVLVFFAVVFWLRRNTPEPSTATGDTPLSAGVLKRPRLMLGVVAIFLYVGAEVSIGSGMTNYLMQDSVLGLRAGDIGQWVSGMIGGGPYNVAQVAGAMVSVYWGLAMVGRFLGSFVLSKVVPGRLVTVNAFAAIVLCLISGATMGVPAAVAVMFVGLMNSIMFPTIFTIALEDLGAETANGSALLCTAIVGGAVVPVLYGAAADRIGLGHALIVPAACYIYIAAYGWLSARGLGKAAA